MDRIKRQRTPVRALITRTVNEVEAELGKAEPGPDPDVLQERREKLAELLTQVNELDERLKVALLDAEDQDDDAYEVECMAMDEYKDKIRKCTLAITKALGKKEASVSPPASEYDTASEISGKRKTYKLPKIEIRKFDGDLRNWIGFWAQFEKIHDDPDIHDVDKFQYLVQATKEGSRARRVVDKYPQSADNYPIALRALKDRFGDQTMLAEIYMRELLNVVFKCREQGKSLALMFDELEANIKAMETLGVTVEQHAVVLYPLIESSLPVEVIKVWQRSPLSGYNEGCDKKPDERLRGLLDFLRQEVKGEERLSYVTKGLTGQKSTGKNQMKDKVRQSEEDIPTVAGLHIGEKTMCVFCDKPHESEKCFTAPNMSLEVKNKLVKEKRRCFSCLRPGHMSKVCKAQVMCPICSRKHSILLCPDLPSHKRSKETTQKKEEKVTPPNEEVKVLGSQLTCSSEAILQTLVVEVKGSKGCKRIRALLDTGSQRSYVTSHVAAEVGLNVLGEESITHVVFGGVASQPKKFSRFRVDMRSINGGKTFTIEALDKEKICGLLPRVPRGLWMKKLQQEKIFVNDIGEGSPPIDLLIGAKDLTKIMSGRMRVIEEGLVAHETVFGWTLMGALPNELRQSSEASAMTVTCMQVSEATVEQLWSLETIGIRDPIEVSSKEEKERQTKEHFLKTINRSEDGRYCVSLPWIDGQQNIPNNRSVAEKRLDSTTRKLLATEGLYKKYEDIFLAWLSEGIIEEVTDVQGENGTHYLPHRAVLKPESTTTPIRPVFDASCKTGRNPSLNDCLEKGPNLLDLIPSILLRFREGKLGVISDIRKAFLMLDVHEKDRDFIRFLWWEDPTKKTLRIFRHKRVVFGVNCSPFLLGAVIDYHLSRVDSGESKVAEQLRDSLYVDNCVTSVDTFEDYDEFREKATSIMARARMELRLWECSSVETSGVSFLTSRECGLDDGRKSCSSPEQLSSVLGLKWNKEEDLLCVDVGLLDIPEKVTKRVVLSTAQKIFDPLGFLCPVLLCPKRLLQEAWAEKTGWDDELSAEIKERFGNWCHELHLLRKIWIPRNMTGGVSSRDRWQLHVFSDASKDAYAAVVYLRTEEEGRVSVQLMEAKSRVAPVKKATIPRLELMGCTIASRLADSVRKALEMRDVPTFYWSDSSTALAWIRRNDEWGTFVGNRVKEILKLTKASEWRHVPGELNPADLPSRGCSPSYLVESRWWEGPSWMKKPMDSWPSMEPSGNEEEVRAEKKKSALAVMIAANGTAWHVVSNSYYKTLRIWSWIRRFIQKCKRVETVNGYLTVEEVNKTERTLIRLLQVESFGANVTSVAGILVVKDEEGLLRVKTKILNREDTIGFRLPLLLPHTHPIVEQLIMEEHLRLGHAGIQLLMSALREKYWILQGRRIIRRVISACVLCKRHTAKKVEVDPAALPEDRVKSGRVFETTGVDLAGPLFIKKGKKAWIVLFTCAVYRCVHLEIVKRLSTDAFLEAFQRFTCRRGRPTVVYSDNGTNFVGLVNLWKAMDWEKITRDCGLHRIQWKLNPPTAAWWGGWWERLVRSIKYVLKRVLGRTCLTYDKLRNVVCETEAYINERPLTTVIEDPEDFVPLTPASFMHEMPTPSISDVDMLEACGFRMLNGERKKILDELKMRFRREYLSLLVQRGKEVGPSILKIGDVVLVGADNKKRWSWPLARIMELIPGKDGKVRVAKVRTAMGELIRPLQRLYPLEVSSLSSGDSNQEEQLKDPQINEDDVQDQLPVVKPAAIITRFGRKVKKPERFQ
jgi:hypothetical protein